jgi:inosine-uridine nucleoside N-ribohydrolase
MPGAPTLLDLDTGIDDALALLLALRSPELDLVGLTCVAGNVTLLQVIRNTLGVLEAAGAPEIPVAAGAERPLRRRLTTATFFHGADGIGGVPLPPTRRAVIPQSAPDFICHTADVHQNNLTLIAVGPLTNVACALQRDPSLPERVKRLIVMGGAALIPGNVTPAAEANFHNDPEAADAVFRAGFDLTMIGLDVTLNALFEAERYRRLRDTHVNPTDPVARLALAVLSFYLKADLATGLTGSPMHDPLAVAVAALPNLVTCRDLHVQIETLGTYTAGASVTNAAEKIERIEARGDHDDVVGLMAPEANCHVALEVDSPRFIEILCARLGLTPAA